MTLESLIRDFAGTGAGYHISLMIGRGYSTALDYPDHSVGSIVWFEHMSSTVGSGEGL